MIRDFIYLVILLAVLLGVNKMFNRIKDLEAACNGPVIQHLKAKGEQEVVTR